MLQQIIEHRQVVFAVGGYLKFAGRFDHQTLAFQTGGNGFQILPLRHFALQPFCSLALLVLMEQGFDLLIQRLSSLMPLAGLSLLPRVITAAGHIKTLIHGRQGIINSMLVHVFVLQHD